MIRDPLAPVRLTHAPGAKVDIRMRTVFGPPLSGISLRSRVPVRRPALPDLVAPFALTRHGRPWVVWRVVEVADARAPVDGQAGGGLDAFLGVDSVEAAFVVLVDSKAGWKAIRLGSGHAAWVPPS